MIWFAMLFGLALGAFVEWRVGRVGGPGGSSGRAEL